MYRIAKRFHFEAAHSLTLVPDEHKCKRAHGHSYTVEIELIAETLDHAGMVRDYSTLDAAKSLIIDRLDHRNLNEVLNIETTAENLAQWIYHRLNLEYPELTAVRVSETKDTWAEYRQ